MSVNLSSEQFMEAVEKEREVAMLQVRVYVCVYVCMIIDEETAGDSRMRLQQECMYVCMYV
jgi:hypothetical protein